MIKIEGFVIVPPLNSWDEKNKDTIYSGYYWTFGRTEVESWQRFIPKKEGETEGDWSIKVQRMHDRGYRLKKSILSIDESEPTI